MNDLNKKILDEDGHLNDSGIVLYAEAMKLRQIEKLSDELQQHLIDCGYCSLRVAQLFEHIEQIDFSDWGLHPILGEAKNIDLLLGDQSDNLDIAIQKLLEESIQVPLLENLIAAQHTYRNSNSSSELRVLFPQPEQLCMNTLTFNFSQAIDKNCKLSLSNHTGRILKTELPLNITEFSIDISDINTFPFGLYYWKLMPKGGKAIVGKVFIYSK